MELDLSKVLILISELVIESNQNSRRRKLKSGEEVLIDWFMEMSNLEKQILELTLKSDLPNERIIQFCNFFFFFFSLL